MPVVVVVLMTVLVIAGSGYNNNSFWIRLFNDFSLIFIQLCYDRSTLQPTCSGLLHCGLNKLYRRPPQYAPAPCKLTFELLNLKVVSESHVTWATSVPILVFIGLSVLDLGQIYVTDIRQTHILD